MHPVLYSLKTSEKQMFSDIFDGIERANDMKWVSAAVTRICKKYFFYQSPFAVRDHEPNTFFPYETIPVSIRNCYNCLSSPYVAENAKVFTTKP